MATKLEKFTFTIGRGPTQYPWDEWTDGSIWQVKRGEDFTVTQTGFGAALYDKAARLRKDGKNRKVRVKNLDNDVVVFQFFDPEAVEAEA